MSPGQMAAMALLGVAAFFGTVVLGRLWLARVRHPDPEPVACPVRPEESRAEQVLESVRAVFPGLDLSMMNREMRPR
jgi:hypothetical protein